MKKLFSLTVLILCSLLYVPCSSAQGNLQFNQVLTQGGSLTAGYCNTVQGQIFTVPAGKVWKIENFTNINNDASLKINFNSVVHDDLVNSPIWLKENDSISFIVSCNNGIGQSTTRTWFLSMIEFNVVP